MTQAVSLDEALDTLRARGATVVDDFINSNDPLVVETVCAALGRVRGIEHAEAPNWLRFNLHGRRRALHG